MDLNTDQKKSSEYTSEESMDTEIVSRKTRDSAVVLNGESNAKEDIHSTDEHEIEESTDYSNLSKEQLVNIVKELSKDASFSRVDAVLREVKPLVEELQGVEKSAALEKFKESGGDENDFEFLGDKLDHEFDAAVKFLRDRKNKYFQELEQQKNHNLFKKNELLDKLRALADGEDTANSFSIFKDIQKEWKSIGPVPNAHSKTLWANYSALIDLYYDQRSIYFELKELDRRKNLEYKIELCERAEKLIEQESIKEAVKELKELNELHEEFRHTGPVPREEKDGLWERFKTASDAVYAKRDEFVASLQENLKKNLEEKQKLIQEVNDFAAFTTDRIKEWNQKTKEVLALQKKWEAVGGVPRAQSKEVNRAFWSAFKNFFNNKNSFFRKLDGEREKNLELKKALVAKANELKESTDWERASNDLKKLQVEWKAVGPVPEKQREKIFAEFKAACDFFFDKRREQLGRLDVEQEENLARKTEICLTIEKQAADKVGQPDELQQLMATFNEIGFVPKKAIKSIKVRFDKAVEQYLSSLQGMSEEDRIRLEMEIQLRSLKNDPFGDRKIQHREQAIRKQITKAENDIAILQNNMEFFGRSKNAEKIKSEFAEKLDTAAGELKALKKQLKMLKTVS